MFNPTAFRQDKTVCNFGLSECNRVRDKVCTIIIREMIEVVIYDYQAGVNS